VLVRSLCSVVIAVLLFAVVTACGGDSVEEDEPTLNSEVPLNQVLTEPERHDAVTVNGRASPLGELGFIIEQQGVSMFVDAEPQLAAGVEDGERVRVTASVEQFSEKKASAIRSAVELDTGDSDSYDERAFAATEISEGAAYLDLIHVAGSDG